MSESASKTLVSLTDMTSLEADRIICGKIRQQTNDVEYNNVFRRLMGYHNFCSASGMFVENRIDNFDARIRRQVYGFYQRLMSSGNALVSEIHVVL